MSTNNFNITKANLEKFSIEQLSFILSSADKLLKTNVENSNVIVTRTTILASTFFTVFSGLSIYIATNTKAIDNIQLQYTAICLWIYVLYLMPKTIKNLLGYRYWFTGSEPKDYLHNHYVDNYQDDNTRLINMYITEIKSYQTRIENNKATNKKRWEEYNDIILHVLYMPFICIAAYFVPPIMMSLYHP